MRQRILPFGLGCYLGVVVALTLLKAFFRIGELWVPANQRVRQVRWIPLDELFRGSWFKPVFEYGGNLLLFVPLGILMFLLLRSEAKAIAWCVGLSALIEASQFLFSLGRTDIDDFLFNGLGATLGVAIARRAGPRWDSIFLAMPFIAFAAFVALLF